MRKEQQQTVMLAVILIVIVGVLLYAFGSRFLPSPQGVSSVPPAPTRLLLPAPDTVGSLYGRDDFKSLREVPGIPVQPMPTNGSPDPFEQPQAAAPAP
jgi:hypothetical protein